MKPECNLNMKELTNIVDSMLLEKNRIGRKAFDIMTDVETIDLPSDESDVSPCCADGKPDYDKALNIFINDYSVSTEECARTLKQFSIFLHQMYNNKIQ